MISTGVAQVVGIRPGGVRIVADYQRSHLDAVDDDAPRGVVTAGGTQAGVLSALVDLQDPARSDEDRVGQVDGVGVVHHQLGEGVVLQLGAEVHPRGTRQVVEAVAVL
ncbi:hypothetical protein D3C84_823050 [compost metagenome]